MRLELTRKSDLAIRALQALHTAGTRVPGREIAEMIGTTTPFISQVVNPLVQHGWLDSKPGPAGGYGLTTDPRAITILEVVELIEGPFANGTCVMAGGPCGETAFCSVHEAWLDASEALRDAFEKVAVVNS